MFFSNFLVDNEIAGTGKECICRDVHVETDISQQGKYIQNRPRNVYISSIFLISSKWV